MNVKKTNELVVLIPNQPGALAKVMQIIAEAKINILAYAGWVRNKQGYIVLVTENNAKAAEILKQSGYQTKEDTCIVVTDTDFIGSCAAITRKIGAAGISMNSIFATCTGGIYRTIINADDADKVVEILQ